MDRGEPCGRSERKLSSVELLGLALMLAASTTVGDICIQPCFGTVVALRVSSGCVRVYTWMRCLVLTNRTGRFVRAGGCAMPSVIGLESTVGSAGDASMESAIDSASEANGLDCCAMCDVAARCGSCDCVTLCCDAIGCVGVLARSFDTGPLRSMVCRSRDRERSGPAGPSSLTSPDWCTPLCSDPPGRT